GLGSAPNADWSTADRRSPSALYDRLASERAGWHERTIRARSLRRSASRHNVVFPMPGSLSITRIEAGAFAEARKRTTASSSTSLPTIVSVTAQPSFADDGWNGAAAFPVPPHLPHQ